MEAKTCLVVGWFHTLWVLGNANVLHDWCVTIGISGVCNDLWGWKKKILVTVVLQ
jgi:hypothetical protein